MPKDPLSMTISLIQSLNLIHDGEYNIYQLQKMNGIEGHWVTIKKYLKIIATIQKYSPEIKFDGSILKISNKNYYSQLQEIEKFIVNLFQKNAVTEESAIPIDKKALNGEILKTEGILFKFVDNKCYLLNAGMDVYRSIEKQLSEIISNGKILPSNQKKDSVLLQWLEELKEYMDVD